MALNIRQEVSRLVPAHAGWMLDAIEDPHFEDHSAIHNWRTYVPEVLEKTWHTLSPETRLVIIAMAEAQSDKETWE